MDSDPSEKDRRERYRSLRQVGLLTSIPMLLLISPLLGYGFGTLADRWLHCRPWGSTIGLLVGMVAGVREVVRIIRRAGEDDEVDPEGAGPDGGDAGPGTDAGPGEGNLTGSKKDTAGGVARGGGSKGTGPSQTS